MAKRLITDTEKTIFFSRGRQYKPLLRVWAYDLTPETHTYAVIIPEDAKFEGL